MSEMRRSGFNGCCAGGYFYDLGGAHSKARSKTLEEFAERIISIGYNRINTAITNDKQDVERGYLKALGFKVVFETTKYSDEKLSVHAVDSETLEKSLAPFRESLIKKKEEEKRVKEEQRQKQQEARKKLLEEQAKSAGAPLSRKDVTAERIDRLLRRHPEDSLNDISKLYFGVELPNHRRDWHQSSDIAKAIRYRLYKNDKSRK